MLTNKRIFITGGAGFIGSTLAKALVQNNQIVIFDNFFRDSITASGFMNHKNLKIIKGDILNFEDLKNALDDFLPTHIVHCAAIAGIDTVIKSPTTTLKINALGTLNLAQALEPHIANIERVLFFSTSEIFGQMAYQSDEASNAVIGAVGEARWTYAVSKLLDEHIAYSYFKEFNMPTVVIRPFNVYGPGQVGEGALSIFIQKALKNETIEIHGTGAQIRAWCYIEDMIEALLKCLEETNAIGHSFNIGNIKAITTIYGLAQMVCRILNSKSKIIFSGRDIADIELRIPNVNQAKKLLNFTAKTDLEEGVLQTAEYYKLKLCA